MGLFSKPVIRWWTTIEVESPKCQRTMIIRSNTPTQRERPCKGCNSVSFEIVLGEGKGNYTVIMHEGYERNIDVTRRSTTKLIGQTEPNSNDYPR